MADSRLRLVNAQHDDDGIQPLVAFDGQARATGMDPALLVQDLVWCHLGADRDAFIVVDRLGMPSLSAGVAMTASDLARLGEVIRRGGAASSGRQLVPPAFLADLLRGGNRAHFAPTPYAQDLPGEPIAASGFSATTRPGRCSPLAATGSASGSPRGMNWWWRSSPRSQGRHRSLRAGCWRASGVRS